MKENVQQPEGPLTEKAGGIITRVGKNGEKEIYLVHRARYNDWSVPKGHMEPGETPLQAALREVGEETGFHCSVEKPLPPYFYQTPQGEYVVVHFFEMNCIEEMGAQKDDEVDEGRWVESSEVFFLISYSSLVEYLHSILE